MSFGKRTTINIPKVEIRMHGSVLWKNKFVMNKFLGNKKTRAR
jgi:hypothetical protein